MRDDFLRNFMAESHEAHHPRRLSQTRQEVGSKYVKMATIVDYSMSEETFLIRPTRMLVEVPG